MNESAKVERNLTGAVLARKYRVERRIGQGAMGTVYAAAFENNPAQKFAIKILHPEHIPDSDVLHRFLEEGRACERLVHPNIVRVHETLTAEDGSPFIVMEMLEGVPLADYTKNGGRVPWLFAATILQNVLAGLAAAHAQGVIHRDLKPENIFLARDDQGTYNARILDFGIAKVMDAAGGMGQRTKTGALLGTPAYMSPEQIRSAKDVDGRTDLFSAGVMLYEMLTGRPAFPAPTEYARLSAVLNKEPTPITEIDPELAALSPIVTRALEKDRDKRYPTALDMARALSQAAGTREGPAARLSALPDVPSLFAPRVSSVKSQPNVMSTPSPSTESAPVLALENASNAPSPQEGPHGTLASNRPPRGGGGVPLPVAVSPSAVVVVTSGTLPSKDLPMLDARPQTHDASGSRVTDALPSRGIPTWVVVVLVLIALTAGFGGGALMHK